MAYKKHFVVTVLVFLYCQGSGAIFLEDKEGKNDSEASAPINGSKVQNFDYLQLVWDVSLL